MQRRQFLGSAAALGGVAVAGSPAAAQVQVQVQSDEGPQPPSVPVDEADADWAIDRRRSGTFSDSVMGVTSKGTTLAYVDEGLSAELEEKTLGADVGDLRLFFASRIEYRPSIDSLPFGVGRSVVVGATESNARERFERRLREAGVENVERRETRSVDIDDGPTADLLVYDAEYPFEGFELDAGDAIISVDGDSVAVEGFLAVWYTTDPDSTLVVGAVNPAENYEQTVERRLSEAIDLTLDVDLGLTPAAYREGSLDLLRAVE